MTGLNLYYPLYGGRCRVRDEHVDVFEFLFDTLEDRANPLLLQAPLDKEGLGSQLPQFRDCSVSLALILSTSVVHDGSEAVTGKTTVDLPCQRLSSYR